MSDERSATSVDEMTLGTVNGSTRTALTAHELADALRTGTDALCGRDFLAVETFLIDVPLETQVLFLAQHGISERHAVEVAKTIGVRDDFPLGQSQRW